MSTPLIGIDHASAIVFMMALPSYTHQSYTYKHTVTLFQRVCKCVNKAAAGRA